MRPLKKYAFYRLLDWMDSYATSMRCWSLVVISLFADAELSRWVFKIHFCSIMVLTRHIHDKGFYYLDI